MSLNEAGLAPTPVFLLPSEGGNSMISAERLRESCRTSVVWCSGVLTLGARYSGKCWVVSSDSRGSVLVWAAAGARWER